MLDQQDDSFSKNPKLGSLLSGFQMNYDKRSNISGKSGMSGGLKSKKSGFTGFGGRVETQEELTEMMSLQQPGATECIRQEYIEEPSFRKSLFVAPVEQTGIVKNKELTPKYAIVMMIIAFFCFGLVIICFKAIYLNYRHTIYEDIYGRSVSFFACSILNYLTRKGQSSVFDLRSTIRVAFLIRILLISFVYIFLFLAIQWSSSFMYVALILCVLPPTLKVIQRYAMIEKKYSFWDVVVMMCAIAGMFFLFRGNSNFVNKNKYIQDDFDFDNLKAYIFGILTIVFWGFANASLQKNKAYVHHSVDTFYTGFFISIILPAFVLGYFSTHQQRLTYEWVQIAYFGLSGVLWWVFHTLFTQVMEQDTKLLYIPGVYVFLAMAIAGDGIVRSKDLAWNQIIAFGLIVGPNLALILLRLFNIVRT